MNKYLLVAVLIAGLNPVSAQTDSIPAGEKQWQFGVRSGFYFTSYLPGPVYALQLTATRGIHEFAIGPSYGRRPTFHAPYYPAYSDRKKRINGIDLSYRVSPNGSGKVFDFYFQFDYLQKWGRATGQDVIYDYPDLYDQTTDRVKIQSVASVLLFEYGFDIRFLKYFYIGPSLGIGGKLEWRKYRYETFTELNHKGFRKDADAIFRVNFGLRF